MEIHRVTVKYKSTGECDTRHVKTGMVVGFKGGFLELLEDKIVLTIEDCIDFKDLKPPSNADKMIAFNMILKSLERGYKND